MERFVKLTKAQREQVRSMFDGRCAYCGCELGQKWHADHFLPVVRTVGFMGHGTFTGAPTKPERDCLENMMPSCPSCNIYKHSMSLEHWRNLLNTIPAMLTRDNSIYRHGVRFGLIAPTGTTVQFHFEKVAAAKAVAA
jgi:hypothetical protein